MARVDPGKLDSQGRIFRANSTYASGAQASKRLPWWPSYRSSTATESGSRSASTSNSP